MRWVFFALIAAAAVSMAQEVPDPVKQAEATGAALFSALSSKDFAGPQDLKNLDDLRRAVDAQKCPGTTTSFILLPDRQHASEVYAVSAVPEQDRLVVGKHFKTTVRDGLADVGALAASTKSCLVLTINPKSVALMTTELISATPTEFHVLEARLHDIPLYVGAGGQIWAVKDGSIRKVDKGT